MKQGQTARVYDLVVPGGGARVLDVVGTYVKVLSATGQVRLRTDTGYQLEAVAGQGLRLDDDVFGKLTFEDMSGASNTLRLLVGFAQMIDDRITGEVSVIDGARARTLAGLSFSAAVGQSAVAAQYTFLQLWNPSGSSKRIVLENLLVYCSAGTGYVLTDSNAALATLGNVGQSKLLGGAASVMEVRRTTSAVAPTTPYLASGSIAAQQSNDISTKAPYVVPAGRGLIVATAALNVDLGAFFQWTEEAA